MKNFKILLFSAMLLAGCGSVAGAKVPEWNASMQVPVPNTKIGRNWRSTLQILPADEQNKKLYDAWQLGITQCMSAHGFTYFPGIYYSDSWMDNWNPLDTNWAGQFGYHIPHTDFSQPEQSTDADFQLTLERNCAPSADKSSYGVASVIAYTTELDRVINDAMRYIAEPGNKAETQMISEWSTCMKRKGHSFNTRHDAAKKFQSSNRISNDEINTVMADISCDQEVGMTSARSSAEEIALNEWKRSHMSDIENVQRLRFAFDQAVAAF